MARSVCRLGNYREGRRETLRRLLEKYADYLLRFLASWSITTVVLWLGLSYFAEELRFADRLDGLQPLDWGLMGLVAVWAIYMMTQVFYWMRKDAPK